MTDNQQSSTLTPCPASAAAGEGSIVTEMVLNHFRKTLYDLLGNDECVSYSDAASSRIARHPREVAKAAPTAASFKGA